MVFEHDLSQVTRKIIRKCVSADGMEHEEVSLEGAPQGSVSMAEGDGYSKVVKRTVLKSEGDHTEVCGDFTVFKIVFFFFKSKYQTHQHLYW